MIGFGVFCNNKTVLPVKTNGILICFGIYKLQTVLLYDLIYHKRTDPLTASGLHDSNSNDFNFLLLYKRCNNHTFYHILIKTSEKFCGVIVKELVGFPAEFFFSRHIHTVLVYLICMAYFGFMR